MSKENETSNNSKPMAYDALLSAGIYDIIDRWTIDNIWYGYNTMYDTLKEGMFHNVKMAHIKREVKVLSELGRIKQLPTFDDDTGKVCGSGWFACR